MQVLPEIYFDLCLKKNTLTLAILPALFSPARTLTLINKHNVCESQLQDNQMYCYYYFVNNFFGQEYIMSNWQK